MGDRAGRWIIAATVAIVSLAPALAADLPLAPAPKPAPVQAPANSSPLAPPTATCREWSDGCRVCQRAGNGEVSCSNVGIACVPKDATCSADAPAR